MVTRLFAIGIQAWGAKVLGKSQLLGNPNPEVCRSFIL